MSTVPACRTVHVEHVMGTVVSIDARAGAADAVWPAIAWLHEVDARFSTYRPDSDIRRLDRGELLSADASPDTRWVLDRCAALFVETGGDVVCRGDALPERGWRVGIQHPHDRLAVAARVQARDLAVATSGAYERGAHLNDPRSGGIPSGVLSVTVTGADLGLADAYSTAAFAMGAGGPAWTLGLDGYEALTILADGTVVRTPGFPLLEGDA
jgi:FAD:protein FMN transferase